MQFNLVSKLNLANPPSTNSITSQILFINTTTKNLMQSTTQKNLQIDQQPNDL